MKNLTKIKNIHEINMKFRWKANERKNWWQMKWWYTSKIVLKWWNVNEMKTVCEWNLINCKSNAVWMQS